MEATEYLKKVEKICKEHENAMKCMSEECPLWEYTCGRPNGQKEITEVITFVKNYQLKVSVGHCKYCGYDYGEYDGKCIAGYCPVCGTSHGAIEKAPEGAATPSKGE